MPSTNANRNKTPAAPELAAVTVYHLGPQDQDLHVLSEILNQSDWPMCPGTKWSVQTADGDLSTVEPVQGKTLPIVLCEGGPTYGDWRSVLESMRRFSKPPMLIVASRTADERLWAEALNLGAYDVLSKPYEPAEVIRVLSMAWLHWKNRINPSALAQAN